MTDQPNRRTLTARHSDRSMPADSVAESRTTDLHRGKPLPLGATIRPGGVNFAVFARHATAVTLELFTSGASQPLAVYRLDSRYHRTGDIWHAFVSGIGAGIEYGYRADRQPNDFPGMQRYAPNTLLIDPYARALSGGESWGQVSTPNGSVLHPSPGRSLVIDDDFDWGDDRPLGHSMSDTIIYELHVRGFTRHASSGVAHPGTYEGLIEKIPYLQSLGVTAVELLPINEFSEIDTDRINPLTGERLLNFWGYNSINFFTPKASFAAAAAHGSQVRQFKEMVRALHASGIEVILDVVFNHTAEGNEKGTTFCFRGLDNSIYYLIDSATGEYYNFCGCGNTMNCNHPVVRDMILEALRYWVTEMHVDGFRFDLASILGRGRDGERLANPPLLERIAEDPILRTTKLIAEAWDAAGLYQVGSFPRWGRWAEWNGKFRDDLRGFVKGDAGQVTALAERLIGSPDLYHGSGLGADHSINFVTCHDGFTLTDLVSFNEKHNEANGEESRDGEDNNLSWNCGFEGLIAKPLEPLPDGLDPEAVAQLRARQTRNLATLLLVSRGVPMLLAGDEFGRTQQGNNNAYCQDNEVSWVDWRLTDTNADLLRFFRLLIDFRKRSPALRFHSFAEEGAPAYRLRWHGVQPGAPDWGEESRSLALQISNGKSDDSGATDLYIAANAYWASLRFTLPELPAGQSWYRKIDTLFSSPDDIAEPGREVRLIPQHHYELAPRSVVVLLGK